MRAKRKAAAKKRAAAQTKALNRRRAAEKRARRKPPLPPKAPEAFSPRSQREAALRQSAQPSRPVTPAPEVLPASALGQGVKPAVPQRESPLRRNGPRLFLRERETQPGWTGWKKAAFWLWNGGWLLVCALAAGIYGLALAVGTYDWEIFGSFFRDPALLARNLLPPVLLIFALWLAFGKSWLAMLIGGFVSLGFPAASYYLLRFRDEPMRPGLLRYLREGFAISSEARYDLTPDGRLWGAVAVLAAGCLILALVARGRAKPRLRLPLVWLPVIAALLLEPVYRDGPAYQAAGETQLIQRYSASQQYVIRGFWYPFLHELLGETGEDLDRQHARFLLDCYADADIPQESQVDLIVLQREGYADFSVFDIPGMDWRCYDLYHQLQAESYTGRLITNTFSGGTVTTERAVLTGQWDAEEVEGKTNSYVWYLKEQGYFAEGCHPCYEWFYDRKEVNPRLGFDRYFFSEDTFSALSGEVTAGDDILLPVVWDKYQAGESPYFNFTVTYQGHGPYPGDYVRWEGADYADGALSGPSAVVMNNYLGSLHASDLALLDLVDHLRQSSRPVVLVVYGDHKPWLGDGASIYQELGINLDLSTQEGFYNYFSTEYLIWGNPAARQALGHELTGQGPDISPCYLMNVLFDQLGWQGSGFAQLMEDYYQVMPVVNVTGRYVLDQTLTAEIPPQWESVVRDFFQVQQLWKEPLD